MSTRWNVTPTLILVLCLSSPTLGYEVGHATITFTDPSRGNRGIPTEIYYPADAAGEDVPLASGLESFPVVTFGHGYLMSVSYTHLTLPTKRIV